MEKLLSVVDKIANLNKANRKNDSTFYSFQWNSFEAHFDVYLLLLCLFS